jgi:hypothetical protein
MTVYISIFFRGLPCTQSHWVQGHYVALLVQFPPPSSRSLAAILGISELHSVLYPSAAGWPPGIGPRALRPGQLHIASP